MKKMIIILTSLFLIHSANAETVKIYNKTSNNMFINYQACFRDLKDISKLDCMPPVYNMTIPAGHLYGNIDLPEYTDLVRIISAYELDDQGSIQAQGDFPNEEDCKSFPYYPATLEKSPTDNRRLICIRNSPPNFQSKKH